MSYRMPNERPPATKYVIGIDPDKNESGFAVWSYEHNKFIAHKTLFFAALQEACFSFKKDECVIYVEAGWENKGMNSYQSKTLPQGFEKWNRARREAYIFQRGTDVGTNFGAGWAITHVLRANLYTVHHYCPKTPKWDADQLRRITGITARTNEEVRDAIRAAYLNK